MTKKNLTPQQEAKRDERRANFKKLCQLYKTMQDEEKEQYMATIITNPEGHVLSDNNTFLINFQRELCTIVAGFQQWKKHGRVVKKGESGIAIWIPTNAPKKEGDATPEEIFFSSTYVFDITQTEELKQTTDTATN